MRIFISAGEPSGDLHAANLVRAIRERCPDAEIVGFGGDHSREAGVKLLFPLTDLAVMWIGRVLINLHTFIYWANQADRYFRDHKPDVVVLIDYPGFHWAIAKRAKARGIKVVYYVPPQLWAWAGWRVEKVRKWVDHVLCSLPFEPEWYRQRGIPNASYVGHPYFDELEDRPVDTDFIQTLETGGGPIVALLPGSRTQELTRNFPVMLQAAAHLAEKRPDVRFLVACLHEKHRALATEIAEQTPNLAGRLEIHAGRTPEIIRAARLAWTVSGSVSLELLSEALPSVVLYKIKPFDMFVAKRFMKTKYICLVNLLAGEELMPEFLTVHDVSADMANYALTWLSDEAEYDRIAMRLVALRANFAKPGATAHAADRVVAVASGNSLNAVPSPHLGKARQGSAKPMTGRE